MKLPRIVLLALWAGLATSVCADLGLAPQPIAVASSLAAKAGATDPAPAAIVFDGPRGDGRGGAKGILLPNELANLRGGTTWSFRYVRGGSAQTLQIIHPVGHGQVIVHLDTDSVGFSNPKSWIEIGYGGGEREHVKQTKAFREIFPLQDGREYAVTSRVSVGGAMELFIDGKEVATGHIGGTYPLSLKNPGKKAGPSGGREPAEFKGANLPEVFPAGGAGLIVGPIDKGENRCTEIRFYSALVDPPAAKP